jgi:hypothetical protein
MPRLNRLLRRGVLGAGAGALVACSTAASPAAPQEQAVAPPPLPEPAQPAPAPAVAPALPTVQPVVAPPPPAPTLTDLGVEGAVQPFWSAGGERVLFYDQPQAGRGGTWSADPVTGQLALERPQWGSYVAGGALLITPRPARRDTYVLHVPSGREWTLPTTAGGLFSADGTVVAYSAATQNAPGGQGAPGGGGEIQPTTLVVSGADGQGARRLSLPINASPVAWVPGADGTPNARLLLSGRRSRQDNTGLYLLDTRDQSLADLVRFRRLIGALSSPDGEWVAYLALWNADSGQDGLWVMRTDGRDRRRLNILGSYRWTADGRLLVIPVRGDAGSHEVWEVTPGSGEARRLTDPAQTPFRIANFDWDLSPDGTRLVFVSAGSRRLTGLTLPRGLVASPGAPPPPPGPPGEAGGGKPYRLPFAIPNGPSGWYIGQWYGITTGGYRGRNSAYSQGQGIHFGIDFAAPLRTPLVAVAPGKIIAVDGDYGSPPHNVVLQLADGNQVMYGHLVERSRHVQVGQTVETGQVVGNSGDSSRPYDGFGNPHVHLELRKGGRAVATNPVPYFDVNWDDLSLGAFPGPRFERNLDDPKRHQFLDDQPDIWFGGPIISNFARPWPV